MDVTLGGLHARLERPQTQKFALPIVILPELFATARHLTMLAGHLVSRGWEVYSFDIHAPLAPGSNKDRGARTFCVLVSELKTALDEIGSEVIAAGHGLGGLLSLKIGEASPVRASVAIAPLIPGVLSDLFVRHRFMRLWRTPSTGLPARGTTLKLVSEAEPFLQRSIIGALIPADTSAAMEVAQGAVEFASLQTPRLIITGEADAFAPWQDAQQFAAKIGASFISLPGRGHWLIASRALEQTVAHLQRFVVRALGEELLLLYEDPDRGD
jgi:alpha-beta hydrolase superfamily lysophospholipase